MKQIIERSGKTPKQISQEAGVSLSFVYSLIKGERVPGFRHMGGLSKTLGVTPAEMRPDLAAMFAAQEAAGE